MSQPVLNHIRILDFSRVLAGPYATRLLADFGAEVIRVQPLLPRESEDSFARSYENMWNRNKRGITLNLNMEEGLTIARKLAGISDAVVENFSPRVMANWGLDYENLKRVKPDLIMLSMSVMGQTGPQRDATGFGPTVQALSGMTYLTSFPGMPPTGLGYSYADHVAGLFASLALLGALEERRKTGKGQHIDLSELEAMASLLGSAVVDFTLNSKEPLPEGNRSPRAAPHNVYRCRGDDRWCALAVFTDNDWQNFKLALGNPSWGEDGKFATPEARKANEDELDRLISGWTEKHRAEEVMAIMQGHGVPAGVVQSAADLAVDLHLKKRGFFLELEQAKPGRTIADANPIRLSETPAEFRRAAPEMGQDNDYVYRGLLGLSAAEIAALKVKKVI